MPIWYADAYEKFENDALFSQSSLPSDAFEIFLACIHKSTLKSDKFICKSLIFY